MNRMKKIRAQISHSDGARRFTDFYGVEIYMGHAKFTGKNSVMVNGKELKFSKACIASGGRPKMPKIEGLDKVKFYTSDSIFNMTVQPKRLLIVGSGPIGCELGQGFARLGTQVTMISRSKQLLPSDDADGIKILHEQLVKDGINFMFET